MHSPTLANDFSFRLTLAFATFQPISFSLRSMPPLQIPCSHTLADSFSLFALFSTLASFVFNNLRTLCAKHRGVGYLCHISAPSAPARSSGGPLRYHLPLSCGSFYFHPLTNPLSSRIDLQHSLFSCTYKSLFPTSLDSRLYKTPGCHPTSQLFCRSDEDRRPDRAQRRGTFSTRHSSFTPSEAEGHSPLSPTRAIVLTSKGDLLNVSE